jgi:hypothetical protein
MYQIFRQNTRPILKRSGTASGTSLSTARQKRGALRATFGHPTAQAPGNDPPAYLLPSARPNFFWFSVPGFDIVLPGVETQFPIYYADMAINKTTRLTERTSLQFRAEVFNVFNTFRFPDYMSTVFTKQRHLWWHQFLLGNA